MNAPTRPEIAFEANNHLGETPLWSADEQVLYWVNCENQPEIHRWDPVTGVHNLWPMPQRVGGIVLKPQGHLLVILAHGVYDFDTHSSCLSLRCNSPLPEYVSLHECQSDRQGRLWVGAYDHHFTPTNRNAKEAAFFRLDGHQLTPVVTGISVANGLAFSPNGTSMYFADSATGRVECLDLDPTTGEVSGRRTFLELQRADGFVDGATVDAQGGYWLAAAGAGALRRYLPDGTLDRVIELPVSNPTKATFGGKNLDTLYVTTTRLQIGPDSAANGGLYALCPGERGLAESMLQV